MFCVLTYLLAEFETDSRESSKMVQPSLLLDHAGNYPIVLSRAGSGFGATMKHCRPDCAPCLTG